MKLCNHLRSALLPSLASFLCAVAAAPLSATPARPGQCDAGSTAKLLVTVNGLKNATGRVRVQLYEQAGFLEKGKWLSRVEAPSTGGSMTLCIDAPRTGPVAVAVRHDANGNGKSDWNDGGGFSGNPAVSLLKLKPSFEAARITVHPGTNRVTVTMNYRQGFTIAPLR